MTREPRCIRRPMSKIDFQLGDTVQLKSGGPVMTVGGVTEPTASQPGKVLCHYFADGAIKPEATTFPPEVLTKVKTKGR